MVYLTPLLAVRWNGIFGAGPDLKSEEWSFGVHFTTTLDPAALNEGYLAGPSGLWAAATDWISNTQSGSAFSNEVWLLEVAAAFVTPGGQLVGGSFTRHQGAPTGGTAAPGQMPLDTSFCITLDAGAPVRGRFGRFYPPVQPGALVVGHASVPDQTNRLSTAQRFLASAAGGAGTTDGGVVTPAVLVVASKTHVINRPVTKIRVGNVPDVQRRRRRSLSEQYSIAPLLV